MGEQNGVKTVSLVVVINVVARALALLAGIMVTSFYGATVQTSAYSYALTLTNIITTIIGTALTTSVVPIYTDIRESHGMGRAARFVNNTISLTILVGGILVVLGILTAPLTAYFAKEGDYQFAVYSIRVMMPAIVFISLSYIFSGVLQAHNHFYVAAMISLPSSLVNVGYMLLFSRFFGVWGLTVAALLGFFVQAVFLLVPLKRMGFGLKVSCQWRNEDVKRIFVMTAPVIIGVCAYQINLLTNSAIAMAYDAEKYIILNNMQNLGVQIVMTLVLAVASVAYPKMSLLVAQKNRDGFYAYFTTAVNSLVLLLLPISVGFAVLSPQIVDMVYGYGEFGSADVLLGAGIFALYGISVLGIGLKEIVDRAFYADRNTKTSAYNGVLIMVVNILLSLLLVRIGGFYGIALAYSIAALAGGFSILLLFKKHHKAFSLKPVGRSIIKGLIGCAVMGAVLLALQFIPLPAGKWFTLIKLGVSVAAGVLSYAAALMAMHVPEFYNVVMPVLSRFWNKLGGRQKG